MRFIRWDQKASSGETNDFCYRFSDVLVQRIQSTEARAHFSDLIDRHDKYGISTYELDYSLHTPYDCMVIRQIQALFQKRKDLHFGDPRGKEWVAAEKFVEAEKLCKETNIIFELERRGEFAFLPGVSARIYRATQKIAQILGDVPSLAQIRPRFGPGSTTQIPKRIASARRKLSQTHACSEELLPIIRDVLEELQGSYRWEAEGDTCQVPVEIHQGKLAFVPKNAKTYRAVVVEPELNSMYQCGIGDYMAKRLRFCGVDISDQRPNQRFAERGSLSNDIATLDLSSASDTVAYELIFALLPVDWALFLSQFRTGTIRYRGMSIRLEKFSSMGNGFTFPLETIIFYALACACADEGDDLSLFNAYGDDIIVPTYAYDRLCELLNAVGFIPNRDKSFADGPFRESCGADYHTGFDIRPSYLKDALHGRDVFRLHNFFARKGDEEATTFLLGYLEPTLIKWGPDGFGDGHLIGSHERLRHKRSSGHAGYTFETYTFLSRRDFSSFIGDWVYPSYCIYLSEDAPITPLGDTEPLHNVWLLRSNSAMRMWALKIGQLDLSTRSHVHSKNGTLGVSVPGVKGYKSIKIYTLN